MGGDVHFDIVRSTAVDGGDTVIWILCQLQQAPAELKIPLSHTSQTDANLIARCLHRGKVARRNTNVTLRETETFDNKNKNKNNNNNNKK